MDKKPEKLVPEIRFKGFTDDWEQRKLGEVAEFYNGDRGPNYPKPSEIVEQGVPFINAGDLINGHIDYHNCKHITSDKFNQLNGAKLKINDIVYCLRGTIGKNGLVNSDANATIASSLVCIRPVKLRPLFLFQILNSSIEERQRKMVDEGAAQPNISATNLKKFLIPVPNDNEQEKIGEVFSKLNHLITLQQRKLKQLKQLKKAMLQIIANNRFLFHTKKVDMIKVRVADIYKITRGNVLARSEISNVQTSKYPYPVYSSQTKNHGLMGYYKDFLFKNAITWTTDGANAGTVKYRKGRFYSTNVNGVLLSSEGLANQLTAELLNLVAFKYVSHVGNPKLMNNTMGEIIFNIPKNVENQQYFSDCIESVINLIDKQEKATDKLNKLKKYLLQKLFI